MLMRGADVRCNFLRSEDTSGSIAAENIDIIADEADGAGGGVIPASAFAAFGANSFTPFFMRKLLHNGNDALKGCTVASPPLLLFEIALVLVRFHHGARFILNANHCIMRAAAKLGIVNGIRDCIRPSVPQPAERERIGNQIDAALIRLRANFMWYRQSQ